MATCDEDQLAKRAKKRTNIVNEIISTEKTYVERLEMTVEVIIQPIREAKILNLADLALQFDLLEQVHNLHSRFSITELEQEPMKLIELFEVLSSNFEIYSDYLVNYEPAMQKRGHLLISNRKFADFVDRAQKDPKLQNQNLESLLIMPVQRIPRYRLLLEQLLKYTPEDHHDYEAVKLALEKVCDIAMFNNEAIRARENKTKLMSIMMEIEPRTRVDLLDEKDRRFIKEGPLLRQCRRGLKEFRFWLLSDQLLYGQGTPLGVFILNRQIHLSKCFVSSCESIYNDQFSFIVESPQKSFIVITPTEVERNEWIDAIQAAIEQQRLSRGTVEGKFAPLWSPDATSSNCQRCRANFSIFFRRHHCRNCGAIVCDNCSNRRFMLAHVDQKRQVRVCDACFDFLTSDKPASTTRRKSLRKSIEAQDLAEATMQDYYDSDDGDNPRIRSMERGAGAAIAAVVNAHADAGATTKTSGRDGSAGGAEDDVENAAAADHGNGRAGKEEENDAEAVKKQLESVRISRVIESYRSNIDESELEEFNALLSDPTKLQEVMAAMDPASQPVPEISLPPEVENLMRATQRGGSSGSDGNSIYDTGKLGARAKSSIYTADMRADDSHGAQGTADGEAAETATHANTLANAQASTPVDGHLSGNGRRHSMAMIAAAGVVATAAAELALVKSMKGPDTSSPGGELPPPPSGPDDSVRVASPSSSNSKSNSSSTSGGDVVTHAAPGDSSSAPTGSAAAPVRKGVQWDTPAPPHPSQGDLAAEAARIAAAKRHTIGGPASPPPKPPRSERLTTKRRTNVVAGLGTEQLQSQISSVASAIAAIETRKSCHNPAGAGAGVGAGAGAGAGPGAGAGKSDT